MNETKIRRTIEIILIIPGVDLTACQSRLIFGVANNDQALRLASTLRRAADEIEKDVMPEPPANHLCWVCAEPIFTRQYRWTTVDDGSTEPLTVPVHEDCYTVDLTGE